MKEHLALIANIYSFAFWPLLGLGFIFCKDPNIRWSLAIFAVLNMVGYLVSQAVRPLGTPYGWAYHVVMALMALSTVKVLIIFRPVISFAVGTRIAKIPVFGIVISNLLPPIYHARICPEELAIRRLYVGYVFTHSLVLLHYIMYGIGALSPGGLYEQMGLEKRVLFNAAYTLHLIIMLLELMLLAVLVIRGVKARLVLRA